MLQTLSTNFIFGSYISDRDTTIKISENISLYNDPSQIDISSQIDSVGHVFIGYGYDLYVNNPYQFANDIKSVAEKLGVDVPVSLDDIILLLDYQLGFEVPKNV